MVSVLEKYEAGSRAVDAIGNGAAPRPDQLTARAELRGHLDGRRGPKTGTDCTSGHCAYGRGHACQVVSKWPSLLTVQRKAWRRGECLADDLQGHA